MPAGTYNIETLEQGATFEKRFTWKNEGGAAINLTGYTARMQIRESFDDVTPEIDLTTENGGITLGGAAGTIDILISATATAALSFSSGVYDLELINGSGKVTRLLKGTVSLDREVTR